MDLPVLHVLRLIAKTLEWNLHFDLEATLHQSTLGEEDVVGREIGPFPGLGGAAVEAATGDVAPLDHDAVALYSQWVHREHERLAAVVVGAQQDLNDIVGE